MASEGLINVRQLCAVGGFAQAHRRLPSGSVWLYIRRDIESVELRREGKGRRGNAMLEPRSVVTRLQLGDDGDVRLLFSIRFQV